MGWNSGARLGIWESGLPALEFANSHTLRNPWVGFGNSGDGTSKLIWCISNCFVPGSPEAQGHASAAATDRCLSNMPCVGLAHENMIQYIMLNLVLMRWGGHNMQAFVTHWLASCNRRFLMFRRIVQSYETINMRCVIWKPSQTKAFLSEGNKRQGCS